MKKRINILVLVILALTLTGCGNKKYEGYWCQYIETATIDVQLNFDVTEKQKQAIEEKINTLDNIASLNHFTREQYAEELDLPLENLDVHENYVILFDSMDSIGTYVDELSKLDGVFLAQQSNAKTNISLYNIQKHGKYTFTNSDEAKEEDLIKGTYKIKTGVITFTPNEKNSQTKMLYIKDGYLCGDVSCTQIYAPSNSTCTSVEDKK
ncbi:MAG: hypothetical protein ACI4WW_06330 [Candidatus Coprovivens sp.]